jgi:hypothetical protein
MPAQLVPAKALRKQEPGIHWEAPNSSDQRKQWTLAFRSNDIALTAAKMQSPDS